MATVKAISTGGSTIFSVGGATYNRGCALRVNYDTSNGLGCQLIGNGSIPENESDPFVIVGFGFGKEEGISITKCFNDKNFVYTFGDSLDQSMLSIKIIGMMGSDATVLAKIKTFYTTNRISNDDAKVISLSYGSSTALLQGYLLGISSNIISSDVLLQSFDLKLLMTGFLTNGKDTPSSMGS